MAGEVKKLSKTIAVVRRRQRNEGGFAGGGEGKGEEELEIEEILKWKVVFGNRPEPMGAEQKVLGEEGALVEEG